MLRFLRETDAEYMLEWMHEKEHENLFAMDFRNMTKEDCEVFIKNSTSDITKNRHYAVCDDNDEYMGTISLKNIDIKHKNAEYAIALRSAAKGTGIAESATKEILKIAFEELMLDKVYLNVLRENQRANAFYRKMGFVYEGVFKEHVMTPDQKKHDLLWYCIFRK